MKNDKVIKLSNIFRYSKNDKEAEKSFLELAQMADNNNLDAQFEMIDITRNLLLDGITAKDQIDISIHYTALAKKNGSKEYNNQMGLTALIHGAYEHAFHYFELGSKKDGNVESVSNLGVCYLKGYGVAKDSIKAVSLFKESSELGYSSAMYNLAQCYGAGYGLDRDYEKELKWLIEAGENGHVGACLRLGKFYNSWKSAKKKDKTMSNKWYLKAIEYYKEEFRLKNLSVIPKIAELYEKVEDYKKAIMWYQRSVDLGENSAMLDIGRLYNPNENDSYGNLDKSIYWYEKALQSGIADAGVPLYFLTYFDKKDKSGLNWLTKAAKIGSVEALKLLGHISKEEGKIEKAEEWYKKLVELDGYEVEGIIELARLFEEFKEYNKAHYYYEELTKIEGYESEGILELARLHKELKEYDKATYYYEKLTELDGFEGRGIVELARLYKELKEYNKAEKYYMELIKIEGYKNQGSDELLYLYELKKEYNKIITFYKENIKKDNYDLFDRLRLGRVYEKTGDFSKAREQYETLVDLGFNDGLIAIGDMYANASGVKKDYVRALKLYEQAVDTDNQYNIRHKIHQIKIITMIDKIPGILQKDIYDYLESMHKETIREELIKLENKKRITRIKKGNSYELFDPLGDS